MLQFQCRNFSVRMREADYVFVAKFWRMAGSNAAGDADLFGASRRWWRCFAPSAAELDALSVAHRDGAEATVAGRRYGALAANEAQAPR